MSFARLNGWALPIRDGSAVRNQDVLGELRPSWGNKPTRRRQAIARKWRGRAFPMEAADADTLEALVEGRGHRWAFDRVDGFFSSAGLGPEAGFTLSNLAFRETGGDSPKCPVPYCLAFFSGEGLVFDAELCPDRWTVLYWQSEDPGSNWTHKIARADLARWENGVRNDALLADEILVEDGALAVGDFPAVDTYIADLVLLPFNASDEFLEGVFRWLVADGWRNVFHLDGDAADAIGGASSPTWTGFGGGVSFEVGDRGKYLLLDDVSHVDVEEGGLELFVGATAISFEAWIRPDPSALVFNRTVSSVRGAGGIIHNIQITAAGVLQVEFEEGFGAGLNVLTGPQIFGAGGLFAFGTWVHLAVSIDSATDVVLAWVNGEPVTISQPSAFGAFTQTPTDWDLGRDAVSSLEYFEGGIDELRFGDLPLTTDVVREHYECGLDGITDLGRGRGFSKLPKLELWGDVVRKCGASIEVVGAPPSATYVQHASKTGAGWRNNSREVALELEEASPRTAGPTLPLRASAALLFDDRVTFRDNESSRRALVGDLPTVALGSTIFTSFPFAPWQVQQRTGGGALAQETSGAWAGFFEGATQVSCVAFVRRSALGAFHTVVQSELGVNTAHLSVQANPANQLYVGGRSQSGDGFQSVTLGSPLLDQTDADAWVCVGVSLDFPAALVYGGLVREVVKSGERYAEIESGFASSAATFGTDRWRDSATDFRVGNDVLSSNGWLGEIAYVGLFRNHVLTESELRQFFRAFRAGIFR